MEETDLTCLCVENGCRLIAKGIIRGREIIAKKEVIDDKEFDLIRNTNKFKNIVKRHLPTLPKTKETNSRKTQSARCKCGHSRLYHNRAGYCGKCQRVCNAD